MNQETFNKLKRESINLVFLFLIGVTLFRILFYKEDTLVVIRTVFSIFWVFILPGFLVMLYWDKDMDFLERLLIGIALSAAIIGISSYYLGLIGLNLRYHGIILPSVLVIIGLVINRKKFF